MARAAVATLVLIGCDAHGTMTYPAPRNPVGELWFTEGAAIGCDMPAEGNPFVEPALPWPLGGFCKHIMKPTLADPTLLTYKNSDKRTPWHAPGYAPVYSPCGLAGGSYKEFDANGGIPPPGFKAGDDGLGLPPSRSPQVWQAGSTAEVWWTIAANHGGGYSYRLCPKSEALTEECFQNNTLNFVGDKSWIVYGGVNSTNRTTILANRTKEGTNPPGSEWTKVPIPSCGGYAGGGLGEECDEPQFPSPVPGLWGNGPTNSCAGQPASGHKPAQLEWCEKKMNFSIVDEVQVPADLPPGEYLLSFRWDCEQTPQIWSQCADVTVEAPTTAVMI